MQSMISRASASNGGGAAVVGSLRNLSSSTVPASAAAAGAVAGAGAGTDTVKRVAVVGGSSRLGTYCIRHLLERGIEVNTVARPRSATRVAEQFTSQAVTVFPGENDDEEAVAAAVKDCDAVLAVLLPFGRNHMSLNTVNHVIRHSKEGARVIFSSGYHPAMDPRDRNTWKVECLVAFAKCLGVLTRYLDMDDQVAACQSLLDSPARWTLVRGPALEEGESEGLPVYSDYVGAPLVASDIVRRIDFALFMVEAIFNDDLVGKAPAIVSCRCESALAHAQVRERATFDDGNDSSSFKATASSDAKGKKAV